MEALRIYLNSLSKFDQECFAVKCGTTIGYLRKAISLKQQLGANICVSIERESAGKVNRMDLRPADWKETWPELSAA